MFKAINILYVQYTTDDVGEKKFWLVFHYMLEWRVYARLDKGHLFADPTRPDPTPAVLDPTLRNIQNLNPIL